jgi:hypothetical protein
MDSFGASRGFFTTAQSSTPPLKRQDSRAAYRLLVKTTTRFDGVVFQDSGLTRFNLVDRLKYYLKEETRDYRQRYDILRRKCLT